MPWISWAGADWGDVPTWVASVGTMLTLAAAVGGLIYEAHMRRRDQEDRDAAQARLVTVTVGPGVMHGLVVEVTNHSDAPVFAVRVLGLRTTPGTPLVSWSRDAATEHPQRGEWTTVLPHSSERCSLLLFHEDGRMYPHSGPDVFAADIELVDSTGLRWQRVGSHPPTRISERPISVPDHITPRTAIQDEIPRRPR